MPLVKTYPTLGAALPPNPRKMLSFSDGDTISIVQPIRMLSCDTPEKEGFAGTAPIVQRLLDKCAARLRDGFYPTLPDAMKTYLLDRLDAEAAARHLRAGHGASARFEQLLAERLTQPDGNRRQIAVMPAGDLIDTYGRLLAYFAPHFRNVKADPLPPKGDPRRATLNLNMIAEGWAAFFPVFPAIGKPEDFNLALAGAENAWKKKLGAWKQEGTKMLLGYEFRLCVRLGEAKTAAAGLAAFTRLCIDLRDDRLLDEYSYSQVPPPYRLWVWKKDRKAAIQQLGVRP